MGFGINFVDLLISKRRTKRNRLVEAFFGFRLDAKVVQFQEPIVSRAGFQVHLSCLRQTTSGRSSDIQKVICRGSLIPSTRNGLVDVPESKVTPLDEYHQTAIPVLCGANSVQCRSPHARPIAPTGIWCGLCQSALSAPRTKASRRPSALLNADGLLVIIPPREA